MSAQTTKNAESLINTDPLGGLLESLEISTCQRYWMEHQLVVFEGPVRSGFLPPKRGNRGPQPVQNTFFFHLTGPNRLKPVHSSPVVGPQPI